MSLGRLLAIVFFAVMVVGCGKPESPERAALRERLEQPAPLSHEEIDRLLDEVGRSLEGKTVKASQRGVVQDLDPAQHDVVLGMIANHVGVFDEGIRTTEQTTVRIVNAPGRPSNPELDAARHLWIDISTFVPTHFEFTSGVATDEFTTDLIVQP